MYALNTPPAPESNRLESIIDAMISAFNARYAHQVQSPQRMDKERLLRGDKALYTEVMPYSRYYKACVALCAHEDLEGTEAIFKHSKKEILSMQESLKIGLEKASFGYREIVESIAREGNTLGYALPEQIQEYIAIPLPAPEEPVRIREVSKISAEEWLQGAVKKTKTNEVDESENDPSDDSTVIPLSDLDIGEKKITKQEVPKHKESHKPEGHASLRYSDFLQAAERGFDKITGRPMLESERILVRDFSTYASLVCLPEESCSLETLSDTTGRSVESLEEGFNRVVGLISNHNITLKKLAMDVSARLDLSFDQREALRSGKKDRQKTWEDLGVKVNSPTEDMVVATLEDSSRDEKFERKKGAFLLTVPEIVEASQKVYDDLGYGTVSDAELLNRSYASQNTRALRYLIGYTACRCLPLKGAYSLERIGKAIETSPQNVVHINAKVSQKLMDQDSRTLKFLNAVCQRLNLTASQKERLFNPSLPRLKTWDDVKGTPVTAPASPQSPEHP